MNATVLRAIAGFVMLGTVASAIAAGRHGEVGRTGGGFTGEDGTFSNFIAPSINSTGTVLFSARLSGTADGNISDSGIYRFHVPAGLAVPVVTELLEVVRESETYEIGNGEAVTVNDLFGAATVLENANFSNIAAPVAGTFGTFAFETTLSGDISRNSAILFQDGSLGSSTQIGKLAREGQDAPDGNGTFDSLTGFKLFGYTGSSSTGGFFSVLDDTTLGSDDNTGLFRVTPGNPIQQMAREGDPPLSLRALATPRMNNAGHLAFLGFADNGAGGIGAGTLYTAQNPGAAAAVITEGASAPEGSGTIESIHQIRINDHDELAFVARLDGTAGIDGSTAADDSALFAGPSGNLRELVREGDFVPGDTARFGDFAHPFSGPDPRPAFNDLGQAAFRIDLTDAPTGADVGIYRASEDEVVEIVRAGAVTEDGGIVRSFDDPIINDRGLVAFRGRVEVDVEISPEGPAPILADAIFISDGESLQEVVRTGDVINGSTVSTISFNNNPIGPANGLSDLGIVAYQVSYDSGLSGIAYSTPRGQWRREDGGWDEPDNWFMGRLPTSAHDVVLSGSTDIDIAGPENDVGVASLQIGSTSGTATATLALGSGDIATVDGVTVTANGIVEGGSRVTGGPVGNEGLIVSTGVLSFAADVTNDAVVHIPTGTSVTFEGAYQGNGQLTGPGMAVFEGLVAPGSSPGALVSEGDVVLAETSELLLEIGGEVPGVDFDVLQVDGTLTLGGTVTVSFIDPFVPAPGMSLVLASAGFIDGEFDFISLPQPDSVHLALLVSGGELTLTASPVPVPAALWLGLSLVGMGWGWRTVARRT